jgi:dUTP pyrophosphatase
MHQYEGGRAVAWQVLCILQLLFLLAQTCSPWGSILVTQTLGRAPAGAGLESFAQGFTQLYPLNSQPRTLSDMVLIDSMTPAVRVQRLHPAAQLPRYAHLGPSGDLAADLHSVAEVRLEPGETLAVATGLAFQIPDAFGALVEDRSGLALRGLTTLAGVIDPGFRGEVKVVLHNLGTKPQTLAAGTRIAQLRLVHRIQASFEEVASLEDSERAQGGFGSTGV